MTTPNTTPTNEEQARELTKAIERLEYCAFAENKNLSHPTFNQQLSKDCFAALNKATEPLNELLDWAETLLCNVVPMSHCSQGEWDRIIKSWRDQKHGLVLVDSPLRKERDQQIWDLCKQECAKVVNAYDFDKLPAWRCAEAILSNPLTVQQAIEQQEKK